MYIFPRVLKCVVTGGVSSTCAGNRRDRTPPEKSLPQPTIDHTEIYREQSQSAINSSFRNVYVNLTIAHILMQTSEQNVVFMRQEMLHIQSGIVYIPHNQTKFLTYKNQLYLGYIFECKLHIFIFRFKAAMVRVRASVGGVCQKSSWLSHFVSLLRRFKRSEQTSTHSSDMCVNSVNALRMLISFLFCIPRISGGPCLLSLVLYRLVDQ